MKSFIKRKIAFPYRIWNEIRRSQQHNKLEDLLNYYFSMSQRQKLNYSELHMIERIRKRIEERRYIVKQKEIGEVNTFLFSPESNLISSMRRSLEDLGDVINFDYTKLGFEQVEILSRSRKAQDKKKKMNEAFVKAVCEANQKYRLDWVLCFGNSKELYRESIQEIINRLGLPIVNLSMDDINSWEGKLLQGRNTGFIELASTFDIAWTTSKTALDWYLVEGGRPIYRPEGFDHKIYCNREMEKDIDVSFVGQCYGVRPIYINKLRKAGIKVQCYGPGWENGYVTTNDQVKIFNRSIISLGFGGVGHTKGICNLKARDFEVPACGGSVYLTTFNSDLTDHYIVGKEILCYHNIFDLIKTIRWILGNKSIANEIAKNGAQRAHADHKWLNRYVDILNILKIL